MKELYELKVDEYEKEINRADDDTELCAFYGTKPCTNCGKCDKLNKE